MEVIAVLIRLILILSPLMAAYCLLYLAVRNHRAESRPIRRGIPPQILTTFYLLLALLLALGPLAFMIELLLNSKNISAK